MTVEFQDKPGLVFQARNCRYSYESLTQSIICDAYNEECYASGDEGGIEEALTRCEKAGGDSVPVTINEHCIGDFSDFQETNETIIGPLCIPKFCQGDEYLDAFYKKQLEISYYPEVDCNKTVRVDPNAASILELCNEECIDWVSITSREVCEDQVHDMDAENSLRATWMKEIQSLSMRA